MGFEVKFKYYDKKTEGTGFDVENEKILKKVIGKATDDIPLEQLAKLVFAQFARRDIYVFDADIYEYAKKKISFKEGKDGIILKNKKFSFDLTCEDIVFNADPTPTENEEIEQPKPRINVKAVSQESPVRWEIYDPSPDIAPLAKKMNLAFTVGKKYPIYSEKPAGTSLIAGMNYLTEDDNGNRRTLNDKHFVNIPIQLEQGFQSDTSHNGEAVDNYGTNMPAIHTFKR